MALSPARLLGFGFVASVLWLGISPSDARADLSACGNIHVEAEAHCELVPPSASCELECTSLQLQAACAAELAIECQGPCNLVPEVDCTGSCEADCAATCTGDPGRFDCSAACRADCSGSCEAHCEAETNRASCVAHCEGSCGASCDGACDVSLPEADCDAGCAASCEGSCSVDSNLGCQLECQSQGFDQCELNMEGTCRGDCQSQRGALFCDGQYVDHGGQLADCVAALRAVFDIEVEGYAYAEGSCTRGRCSGSASAGASASCAAVPGRPLATHAQLAIGLLSCLLLLWRRRRIRS